MLGNFGKYRLIEKLAEGGMAEVFKASVQGSDGQDRVIAIKRLHRHFSEDPELTQMLVDEARIAVQLNHPNIAQVFDLGRIDEQCFIIMEHIAGADLQFILERSRGRGEYLPIPAVLLVMSDTLAALHYAHAKADRNGQPLGIVHRDVSPQNIMVAYNGQVKLVDFGIAKATSRAQTTQHGIIKGKFYYMSPEQAHGHHVDARSDVYAAGMVLYETLVARSPYEDVPEPELLNRVRRADFPPPTAFRPNLDPELSRLVMRAVERNPDHRYANAMEFQLAINDFRQRRCPSFQYRQLAELVARYVDQPQPSDPYDPMVRQVYRASTESMLFEKPEDSILMLQSQEISFLGTDDNPFADDSPTVIYDKPVYAEPPRQHELPPSPHHQASVPAASARHPSPVPRDAGPPPGNQQPPAARAPGNGIHYGAGGDHPAADAPMQAPAFEVGSGDERATVGALPSNRQRPTPAPERNRGRGLTQHALLDRFAKPMYVYLALLISAGLVIALVVVWYWQRPGGDQKKTASASQNNPLTAPPQSNDGKPDHPAKKGAKIDLAFTSTPPNSTVYIDDVEEGTTPVSVDLEVGKTYHVEILKDGYEAFEKDYEVPDKPRDIRVKLREAHGVIRVMSFPPDAKVEANGEEVGTTPVDIAGLSTDKEYKIKVSLDGKTREKTIAWKDDQKPIQDVMFQFQKPPGSTEVSFNIDDAKGPKKHASHTYHKKRRRRSHHRKRRHHASHHHTSKPKPKPKKSASEDDGDFDIWGDSSDSSADDKKTSAASSTQKKEDSDDSFSVWGDSGDSGGTKKKKKKKKKKAAPKKKRPAKKKKDEKKDDDDGLDVW